MTISTDFAIINSMLSFVPKYWMNWQILVAILNEFRGQRFPKYWMNWQILVAILNEFRGQRWDN